MYKIYLSPSTEDKSFGIGNFGTEEFRMNQITDVVEKLLINSGNFIVYRNKKFTSKEDIIEDSNKIKADIHIAIHSNYGKNKGPECYVKVNCEKSNGIAKEIYKEIMSIYYDNKIDNGLFYEKDIKEINSVNSPAVLVEVGFHDNENDASWIVRNIEKIGIAIYNGITKGIALKTC